MPDVSVYITLCDMLGISINEFFAGEHLTEKEIEKQSEKNILGKKIIYKNQKTI